MKYGLSLPNGAVDARTLVEFGGLAEEAGWDGVFLEDYIVYQNREDVPTHDPWAILAGMALRTSPRAPTPTLFIKLAAPRIPSGWTPYLPATA